MTIMDEGSGQDEALDATAEEDADLRVSLAGLASLATGEMTLSAMLTHVAEFAVAAIPGADGAGVTLMQRGRADTIVASADFVREVDAVQYGIGEGPCITAAAEGVTVRSGALGTDATWPRFGARVRKMGVHSALSLPLVTPLGILGAMNVYAHAEHAFDDRAVELGELFAVPAAVSVQNATVLAQALELAGQLQRALGTRAVIDQALGILMSRSGAGADEAFVTLTTLSQRENRKLAVVAQRLVDDAVRRARARHARA
ncbi:GAF and ANTAR domain-containing protein [Rhodococcus antarcticus]|jgi:GAF domain-containing protein|uniref:GAF and ANTAR domain-containing protein n=1 Tax=Rhodococcus antarcticus TaxID=2987751 RepID=A0ABY6P438_9NOCA|nr:GAF and ANTAR domain-containing protein [Rhodococcus antarcticus]UZJ26430.1 GAF and ANTAR domain-containing protein [Rhodococcus antarcticus]